MAMIAAPSNTTHAHGPPSLGGFVVALGDVLLRAAVVLALLAAPVLAVQAMTAGVSFIRDTLARY